MPQPTESARGPQDLLAYLRGRVPAMTELLRAVVELESPSLEKEAADRLVSFIAAELKDIGCTVRRIPQESYGDHLLAEWWPVRPVGSATQAGSASSTAAVRSPRDQVLVLCHLDTVWATGEIARRPFRVEGGRAYGPGVMDMKGGVVQALTALRTMGELGFDPHRRVVLVFNTDEEVGSPTSRALIEEQAAYSAAVLVLEPPVGVDGKLKTSRKGVGMFEIRVRGRAAHSGADHRAGVNAIQELAHQILRLQGLTDYGTGTTVNVGVVSGGTRRNVVPAEATAGVDLRVSSKEEADRVIPAILGLKPVNPKAQVSVTGGLNRPPMERSEAIARLFRHAAELARELGLQLDETSTGGASDGNFTASLGVPTLDGLGAVGEGGHAPGEYIVLSRLPERTALLIRLLQTV